VGCRRKPPTRSDITVTTDSQDGCTTGPTSCMRASMRRISGRRASMSSIMSPTGIVVAGSLAILIALVFDGLLVAAQRVLTPWRTVRAV